MGGVQVSGMAYSQQDSIVQWKHSVLVGFQNDVAPRLPIIPRKMLSTPPAAVP